MNYYWPIIMIVGANVCYHICAKSTPEAINPLASLGITYLVGAATVTILYFLTSPVKNLAAEYTHINWTVIVLGFALVGLEYGSINMYKQGWNISIGSLVSSIALAVVLIVVGVLIYKETINVQKVIGMLLCIAGLIMINK